MKRFRALRFVLLTSIVMAIGLFAGTRWDQGLPASTSYRKVMAVSPSQGVSNLAVVHHQRFMKEWIWMRFDASGQAMSRIFKNRKKVENEALIELANRAQSHLLSKATDEAARNAVSWSEVDRIKHPTYFDLSRSDGDRSWYSTAIVDRENKTIYVFAVGD